MILIKHLVQHQDQRKLAETYRRIGHDLGLEPKDENEKGTGEKFSKGDRLSHQ